MPQVNRITILLLLSLLFAGCSSSWKMTGAKYKKPSYYFEPPPRWMISRDGPTALLSKHGPSLEKILILRQRTTDTLNHTKLKLYPEMLPHELGEVLLSRVIAAPQVTDVLLLKEEVTNVDYRQAVKLTVSYRINAIEFNEIIYAFIDRVFLYELRYCAVKRYYYEENLNTFETLVKGFKLR
ncbi:MAG TPA: hypothetical protein VHP36_00530 [Chitinispirillaceae bacterium]|nr:hypothetical protein [Chitinispirillaceae bacterium]